MNLLEKTRERLSALGAICQSSRGQPGLVDVTEARQHFVCELAGLESLGCEFTRFSLTADRLMSAGIDELKKVSDALSARITYLLEPIRPIETDAEQCVVQLRSMPPSRDDGCATYYELLVRRGGELSLRRWAKTPGDERRPIAAQVTLEVFLRLVADFSTVAG